MPDQVRHDGVVVINYRVNKHMDLENVVPWGRSLAEYREMFALTDKDLAKKILGCGDGPASFNAELTVRGGRVISADPIYAFSGTQIRDRIDAVYPDIMSQMKANAKDYLWTAIASVEALGETRMAAMKQFIKDYEEGKKSGRYIEASLPELPYGSQSFDMALCSHYLFLYSAHVDEAEHIASMKALCRVAEEVRVYPLISLDGKPSQHLEPVMAALAESDIDVSLKEVPYQFQKGATHMLVARKF